MALPLGSGSQYALQQNMANVTAEVELVKGHVRRGFLE